MSNVESPRNGNAIDRVRKKDPPAKGLAELRHRQELKNNSLLTYSESEKNDNDDDYHPDYSSDTSSADSDCDNADEEADTGVNSNQWSFPVQQAEHCFAILWYRWCC